MDYEGYVILPENQRGGHSWNLNLG